MSVISTDTVETIISKISAELDRLNNDSPEKIGAAIINDENGLNLEIHSSVNIGNPELITREAVTINRSQNFLNDEIAFRESYIGQDLSNLLSSLIEQVDTQVYDPIVSALFSSFPNSVSGSTSGQASLVFNEGIFSSTGSTTIHPNNFSENGFTANLTSYTATTPSGKFEAFGNFSVSANGQGYHTNGTFNRINAEFGDGSNTALVSLEVLHSLRATRILVMSQVTLLKLLIFRT